MRYLLELNLRFLLKTSSSAFGSVLSQSWNYLSRHQSFQINIFAKVQNIFLDIQDIMLEIWSWVVVHRLLFLDWLKTFFINELLLGIYVSIGF